ncbi:hypothetical protein B0H11DRAFT_1907635 [Mycena galericulata]|nr:hypothetical protein B0H11DRAFT_1907635 [Mycena galericulata]
MCSLAREKHNPFNGHHGRHSTGRPDESPSRREPVWKIVDKTGTASIAYPPNRCDTGNSPRYIGQPRIYKAVHIISMVYNLSARYWVEWACLAKRSPIRLPIPKSGNPEIPEPLLQRAQRNLTPARIKNKYCAIQKVIKSARDSLTKWPQFSKIPRAHHQFRARIINFARA